MHIYKNIFLCFFSGQRLTAEERDEQEEQEYQLKSVRHGQGEEFKWINFK